MDVKDCSFEELRGLDMDSYRVVRVNGIDQKSVDDLYAATGKFFAAPQLEKIKYLERKFPGAYWGYRSETARNGSSREGFQIPGPVDFAEHGYYGEGWPTDADFPGLRTSFFAIHDAWGPLNLGGCGQTFIEAMRYRPEIENEFKIGEHEDDTYTVAFTPLGEPLEVLLDEWFVPQLDQGQALVVAPGVPHRVRNAAGKERFAIIVDCPVNPI